MSDERAGANRQRLGPAADGRRVEPAAVDHGLVRDKTDLNAPSSIAAVGLALASIPVIVERGVVIRKFAAKIARRRLRHLLDLPQGPQADAAGHKGFFYHFLDIESGRRVWNCELSTLDSAFLFAGVLACATYFDADTADEAEVRRLADSLYCRADWDWARDGGATLTHGWRPETGFIPHRYEATTRDCSFTYSAWARLRTRSPRRVTPPTARPTSGSSFTAGNCSIPGRCL